MSKQKPELENDERSLWLEALNGAQPLRSRARAAPPQPKRSPEQLRLREHEDVLKEAMFGDFEPEDLNTGDETEYRRDGVAGATVRKLRRGQFAVQGWIDLHGLTRAQANAALGRFMHQARDRDWRCIKIIHGKGLRSPQGVPVLKSRVEIALKRNDDVLAYCSAPTWAGGHGAVLVLLRKR